MGCMFEFLAAHLLVFKAVLYVNLTRYYWYQVVEFTKVLPRQSPYLLHNELTAKTRKILSNENYQAHANNPWGARLS
jgi:hypothetical protein